MPRVAVRRITRFTVMATLQAARVRRLGLPEGSALSWGLNRAIFYAAAKRGFGGTSGAPAAPQAGKGEGRERNLYSLGNDEAYTDPSAPELRFTIGGETQTPEAFQRQVAARFGEPRNFEKAWAEAMEIVSGFDEATLRSGRGFYSDVYKPRRDALVSQWSEEFLGSSTPSAPAGPSARAASGRRAARSPRSN
jgi:hypothetical protein